jgi:hypothetical protein
VGPTPSLGGARLPVVLTCGTCGREGLTESDFAFRNKVKQKRHSCCRECRHIKTRAHCQPIREEYFAKGRIQLERLKVLLNDLKRQPCAECGQTFHPRVMDYDHRPGSDKLSTVSGMAKSRKADLARMLEEIKK